MKKKFPASVRKHIRLMKSRLRREFSDKKKRQEMINQLYDQFSQDKQVQKIIVEPVKKEKDQKPKKTTVEPAKKEKDRKPKKTKNKNKKK